MTQSQLSTILTRILHKANPFSNRALFYANHRRMQKILKKQKFN